MGSNCTEERALRCHGSDGAATQSYPNIKPLKGIGNRHNEQEIIQLTANTGIVQHCGVERRGPASAGEVRERALVSQGAELRQLAALFLKLGARRLVDRPPISR